MTQDLQGLPVPDLEKANPDLVTRLLKIEEELRKCSNQAEEKN